MDNDTIKRIFRIARECGIAARFDERAGGVVLGLEHGDLTVFTYGEAVFELGF